MFNTAARDSRDESRKMLPVKHCICNIRHKATLRKTHRCQQQLLIHKSKSMVTSYMFYQRLYVGAQPMIISHSSFFYTFGGSLFILENFMLVLRIFHQRYCLNHFLVNVWSLFIKHSQGIYFSTLNTRAIAERHLYGTKPSVSLYVSHNGWLVTLLSQARLLRNCCSHTIKI